VRVQRDIVQRTVCANAGILSTSVSPLRCRIVNAALFCTGCMIFGETLLCDFSAAPVPQKNPDHKIKKSSGRAELLEIWRECGLRGSMRQW
jgi:hypothetical protein